MAGIVHLMGLINSPNSYNYRQVSAEDMEYTIRCMDYFEKSAIAVYEHLGGNVQGGNPQSMTQAEIIRLVGEKVGIQNQAAFSLGIGKDPAYVSRVLKS